MGDNRGIVYINRVHKPFEVLKPGEKIGKRYDLKGAYDLIDNNPSGYDFFYSGDVDMKLKLEGNNRKFKKAFFSRQGKISMLEQ